MILYFKRLLAKRRQLRNILREAIYNEAMATVSDATIKDIELLRFRDEESISLTELMIGKINKNDLGDGHFKNDYEKRKRVKELEDQIETLRATMKGRFHAIESAQREKEVYLSRARELWRRYKIFKENFK